MPKKIAVYTAITGGYDLPKENQYFDEADFFIFTDDKSYESKWKKESNVDIFKDPRRSARQHKLLSHLYFPDYEYTIWIDGSVEIKCPIPKLVDEMGKADILTFKHPDRDCAYEEALVCMERTLDDPQTIANQVSRMLDDGYPVNNGLAETKVMVRRNNKKVAEFNKEWFSQLMFGSLRDQLSFNYSVWKTGVKVNYMPAINRGNSNFVQTKHLGKREYGTR